MTPTRKWWILPPAVALLLVLGPLSMRGETAAASRGAQGDGATRTAAQPPAETTAERTSLPLPRTPDLWQVGSTLVGVLLLGAVVVMVLRRLRQGPAAVGAGAVTLRQTLRLSNKQAVHALEFDGRMLLIGDSERGLQLLHATLPPSAVDDEMLVAAAVERLGAQAANDDDGAVPRDLVLPRPAARTPRTPTAPSKVRTPGIAAAPSRPRTPLASAIGDFRTLLAKVGR